MRHLPYLKLQGYAVISLLAAVAAGNACSSGSDTPGGTKAGSGGAGGSATSTTTNGTAGSTTTSSTTTDMTTTTSSTTTTMGTGGSTGTGGAGTGGAGGGIGKSVCDGTGTRLLMDPFVDDFEGAAVKDGWSTFNDVTPINSFKLALAAGGAVNTGHAGHYAGTGAKTPMMSGFGVGLIYNAAIDKTAGIYCINIANYDGITFWAKAATPMFKVDVNFVLPETNAVADGGDCVNPGCYNHPRKTITLTTMWAQYSVAFADAAGGSAKVTTRIQELGWLTPYTADWDYSIDEIQFYKGTPPTGPAAHGDGGP
jgi:hypothetical protein